MHLEVPALLTVFQYALLLLNDDDTPQLSADRWPGSETSREQMARRQRTYKTLNIIIVNGDASPVTTINALMCKKQEKGALRRWPPGPADSPSERLSGGKLPWAVANRRRCPTLKVVISGVVVFRLGTVKK